MLGSRRTGRLPVLLLIALLAAAVGDCAKQVVIPSWDPAAFSALDTLEFLTVGPGEGPHWSTVWMVVLDGDVYIRLGSRAADRMQKNATAPDVGVRIGGREYEHVHVDDAAPMAARVAAAMADKYTSDLLVRHFSHPLTLRLEPAAAAGGA
jgi:hypothetical protein